jgi:hypothetical protein
MSLAALLLALGFAATVAAQDVPDHFQCYKVKDPLGRGRYTATIGGLTVEPGCVVKLPAVLVCVPATKTDVVPTPPGGGEGTAPGTFGCYKVHCPDRLLPAIPLHDQFGSRTVTPRKSKLLCAPAAVPCAVPADCPSGTACDTASGRCESTCGGANHTPCNGGCCGSGTCHPGTAADTCGAGGGPCIDCTLNSAGGACVMGHCGCASQDDCPAADPQAGIAGRACLLAGINLCVTSCNAPNVGPCNGGCCSAAIGGTCLPGTSDAACGTAGNTCIDCQGSTCIEGFCQQ